MIKNSKPSKNRAITETIIFLLLVIADAYGFVLISQTIFIIILVWISLRLRKDSWGSIGFRKPSSFSKSILIGVTAGVLLELLSAYITTPIISDYFGGEPDYSTFSTVKGSLPMMFFFIAFSWILGAFGEEICFRGFLMKRLAEIFGSTKNAWIIGLVLSSILFGFGHTEQGISGWVQEGLSGLYLGILFLVSGKNLTVPIISHGISNTLAFVLMYLGQYPGMT